MSISANKNKSIGATGFEPATSASRTPRSDIVCADCLEWMEDAAKIGRVYQLVFCDPPFNIGHQYSGFHDQRDDYVDWISRWLDRASCLVSPRGVLCLHAAPQLQPTVWRAILNCCLEEWYEQQLVWHFRFGENQQSRFTTTHALLTVLRPPGGDRIFNSEDVLVDSDRKAVYRDPRIEQSRLKGRRVPGTVWGVPSDGPYWGRVQGNSRERRQGHPNQLPERYLERIIRSYTDEGGEVLDPFGGSGTTAVVARRLGRNCTTIEISKDSCESIRQRLKKGAVRL